MRFLTEDEVVSLMKHVNSVFKKDDRVYCRAAVETKRLSPVEYQHQISMFVDSVNCNNVSDLRDIPSDLSVVFGGGV